MLSPRTLSLRAKNRALLKALDKYTDFTADITSSPHGLKTERDGFIGVDHRYHHHTRSKSAELIPSFHQHISKEDLSPRQPFQWQSNYIPRHKSESNLNFCGNEPVNSSPSATDMQKNSFSFLQREKNLKGTSPLRPSALDCTGDLRAIVHDIISDMKESKPHKTTSLVLSRKSSESRNSTNTAVKSIRGKSISLQQRRAAEAQMHAPTHSHLLSKCSCTDLGKVRAHPDSKYIVQLYGHKQRIPSRLKRQRYRADSISRPQRTVKWADTDDRIFLPSSPRVESYTFSPPSNVDLQACGDFSANCVYNSPRQAHSSECRESQSSFLDRVRTFRESHWDDCHASPRGGASSEHECVHHYILNRRLFLEPVHTVNGESRCPVCTLGAARPGQRSDYDPGVGRLANARPSKIMVTLPTVLLEDGPSTNKKSNTDVSIIRKMMRRQERTGMRHS